MPDEKDYAIVIGINGYSRLPALTAPQADAAKFIEWLIKPDGGGLTINEVKEVYSPLSASWTDPRYAPPIAIDIDAKLWEVGIGQNPQPKIGRRLYFYFAGHGYGQANEDVGMLMANAGEPEYLTSNLGLMPCRDFFRNHHLFDEVIFILDCCRDAGYKTKTNGFGIEINQMLNNEIPRVEDFTIMATPFGEKAFAPFDDKTQTRRGLLTKALLEGLSGESRAADAQGRITAESLRNYVRIRVKELAKDLKTEHEKKQEADIPEIPRKEIIFGKVTGKIQTRIIAPDGLAGDLIVLNGMGDTIEQKVAAQATRAEVPWVIPLLKTAVPYWVKHSITEMEVKLSLDKVEGDIYEFRFPRPE